MELPTRATHDDDAAGALALLMARHRDELAAYLDPHHPDPSNVPPAFWNEVQRDTEDELAAILLLMFVSSAEYHGASGGSAQAAGSLWSAVTAMQAAAAFTQTSVEMFNRYGAGWNQRLLAGEAITLASVEEDINRIFGPSRAARMAVDAVTAGQTAGGEWGIAETVGKSPEDWWKNNPHLSQTGPCAICEPLNGQPRAVWQTAFPDGPPAHSNCVCEIVYVNLDVAALN